MTVREFLNEILELRMWQFIVLVVAWLFVYSFFSGFFGALFTDLRKGRGKA